MAYNGIKGILMINYIHLSIICIFINFNLMGSRAHAGMGHLKAFAEAQKKTYREVRQAGPEGTISTVLRIEQRNMSAVRAEISKERQTQYKNWKNAFKVLPDMDVKDNAGAAPQKPGMAGPSNTHSAAQPLQATSTAKRIQAEQGGGSTGAQGVQYGGQRTPSNNADRAEIPVQDGIIMQR